MTITSSPPIRTSSIVTIVSSGLNERLARLYGSQHFVHAVEDPDQLGIDLVRTDHAEHRAGGARRAMHVHAEFDETRNHRIDLRLGGPFLHHDDHDLFLAA
jgi:hypothetical protein